MVWQAAFFALLCLWGQGGGAAEEGRGGLHCTCFGINESFTLQEFHILSPRDHPQMTFDDFLTPFLLQLARADIQFKALTSFLTLYFDAPSRCEPQIWTVPKVFL